MDMEGYNSSFAPKTSTDAGNKATKIEYKDQTLAGNSSTCEDAKENPKN